MFNSRNIIDFANSKTILNWQIITDGVMGGCSKGKINYDDGGFAVFHGQVSTENNGGFVSVKYAFPRKNVNDFEVIKLKIKGDRKTYQLRLKADLEQEYSYIHEFDANPDWEIKSIPLKEFFPSFRGNKINRPNYPAEFLEEIAFLIRSNNTDMFSLMIEKVWLS